MVVPILEANCNPEVTAPMPIETCPIPIDSKLPVTDTAADVPPIADPGDEVN